MLRINARCNLRSKTPSTGRTLAFLLEETARKILPEAVLACCVSGIIHVRCGYYRWGSRDAIRYSELGTRQVRGSKLMIGVGAPTRIEEVNCLQLLQ